MKTKLPTIRKPEYLAIIVAIWLTALACEETNSNSPSSSETDTSSDSASADVTTWVGTGPYGIVSFVGESYFLGILNSLNDGPYTQKNAVEADGMHSIHYHNGKIYQPPHYLMGGTSVRVFTINANNTLTLENSIPVAAGSGPGPIHFVSATKAYMPLVVSGLIQEFNPTTLAITDEIDLRSYAVGSTPTAGDDNSPEPTTIISHNNKLYVALTQTLNDMQMGRDVVQVAVIDMVTNDVETIIEDTSRGFTMPSNMAGESGTMFIDENGDLYVHCTGSWGWVAGQKAGYLRIDTTTNTFDTTWEIDLSKFPLNVAGGKIDYINRAVYAGNGIVYGAAHVPGAESNPVDWVHDRIMSYVKVDVWNKTIELLPLPATSMYGAALTMDGDYLVVAEYNDSGTGLYVYNTVTETVVGSPAISTEGSVMLIRKLE